MWTSAAVLLLLSASLPQESAARSTLDLLHEFKNRIFTPGNASQPTQNPDLDEENGASLPQNTTLDETFGGEGATNTSLQPQENLQTTGDGLETQVNLTNMETFDNDTTYQETEHWETGMQDELIKNNTQYYDEQVWNNTAAAGYERKAEYETEDPENGTTNINDTSNIQQNIEKIEETKYKQKKRDFENETEENITFEPEILTKKYYLNTTVFIGENANSTVNHTQNIVKREVPDSSNITDYNASDFRINNDSTTSEVERENPHEFYSNLTDVNNTGDETGIAFQIKENDSELDFATVLRNTSDQQISNFTLKRGSSLKEIENVYSNTTEHGTTSNQSDGTDSKVINSTDMGTTAMENFTATHIDIDFNETKEDCNNKTSKDHSTVNRKDTNKGQISANNMNNEPEIIEENTAIIDKNATNKESKQRINLENVLLNSTQILENFFQNITQELPSLDPDIFNLMSSGRVEWPVEENYNRSTNVTYNNVNSLETITESNIENVNYQTKTVAENNNANETKEKSDTLDPLVVENMDENLANNIVEFNTTDVKSPSESLECITLENNTTEHYQDSNKTEANYTSESVRKKRSLTLTFGEDEELESSSIVSETTLSTSDTEELLLNSNFNSTGSSLWNETAREIGCCSQNQTCTDSSECCEHFVCVTQDGVNSTSHCDFRPLDPDLPTPLAYTGNNRETQP